MIPTQRGGRGYEEDDEVVSIVEGAGGKCCSDREDSVSKTQSVLDWVCLCHTHERCLNGVDITFVQSAVQCPIRNTTASHIKCGCTVVPP